MKDNVKMFNFEPSIFFIFQAGENASILKKIKEEKLAPEISSKGWHQNRKLEKAKAEKSKRLKKLSDAAKRRSSLMSGMPTWYDKDNTDPWSVPHFQI